MAGKYKHHLEGMGINAAREQTAFGGRRDSGQITVTMKSHSKQDRKQLNISWKRMRNTKVEMEHTMEPVQMDDYSSG